MLKAAGRGRRRRGIPIRTNRSTIVFSGRVEMSLGDETTIAGLGEVVHIPGGVEHGAVALGTAVIADVFHPVREDFLEKLA
ncbi:hypothetical protein ATER59S_05803 [Aquamicrobium terrae]